jgi:hypothetical protein
MARAMTEMGQFTTKKPSALCLLRPAASSGATKSGSAWHSIESDSQAQGKQAVAEIGITKVLSPTSIE